QLLPFSSLLPPPPASPLFPYTTLFRSCPASRWGRTGSATALVGNLAWQGSKLGPAGTRPSCGNRRRCIGRGCRGGRGRPPELRQDRKSTRLNSSHVKISYAVFCLKKKI